VIKICYYIMLQSYYSVSKKELLNNIEIIDTNLNRITQNFIHTISYIVTSPMHNFIKFCRSI